MSFEDLRDSVYLEGLEGSNVRRVKWKQFMGARVSPYEGMVPVFLAVFGSLEEVCH
jgi:hypothetical protein